MNIYWLCWSCSITLMIRSKILAKSPCLLISEIACKDALSAWQAASLQRQTISKQPSAHLSIAASPATLQPCRGSCTQGERAKAPTWESNPQPSCRAAQSAKSTVNVEGSTAELRLESAAPCAGRRRRAAQTSSTSALQSGGAPPRRPAAAPGVQRHQTHVGPRPQETVRRTQARPGDGPVQQRGHQGRRTEENSLRGVDLQLTPPPPLPTSSPHNGLLSLRLRRSCGRS